MAILRAHLTRLYWLINDNNNKIRRNIADIKPRYAKPVTEDRQDTRPHNTQTTSKTAVVRDHVEKRVETPPPHVATSEANTNSEQTSPSSSCSTSVATASDGLTGAQVPSHDYEPPVAAPAHRRTMRALKPRRDSDFVYY